MIVEVFYAGPLYDQRVPQDSFCLNAQYTVVRLISKFLAAESYNVEELFSRIACLTFNDILTRESRHQVEKKAISPVAQKGPRKIQLDQDFIDKEHGISILVYSLIIKLSGSSVSKISVEK